MNTDGLYEQWERQVSQTAREQTQKRTLAMLYEARFGAMPSALTAVIEATHDTALLDRWLLLVATRSPEEVATAVQAGASAPQAS